MLMRVAKVTGTREQIYNGNFTATEVGTGEKCSVVMTTPIASHPVNQRYHRFSGLYGPPTYGTEIIIKKVDNSPYWYYDSTVSIPARTIESNSTNSKIEDIPYKMGSRLSLGETMDDFTHQSFSQKVGLGSPEGHTLVLDDSSNKTDRSLGASLTSKIGQQLGLFVSEGISILKNETRDGITVTSDDSKSVYGDRSYRNYVYGNSSTVTTNGTLNMTVGAGGKTCDINNIAIREYNTDGTAVDNDNGSINISSRHNDVTIKVFRNDGGRIFIDASKSAGVVSIKAGSGGVEVYTSGDMHFLSEGSMNFKAGGDITLKGSNVHLNPPSDVPKTSKADFTKDNAQLAEEAVS